MQQRCIICNWMRKCTTKNPGFNDYYISAALFITLFLSGGVDLLWKYSPLHWHHCRCSEMHGEMGSGKVKRGRKYFWQLCRRGNVSRTRPVFFFCGARRSLRHRPAGSHGIICPQQEKPWRCGKRLLPLTMLAGQPKELLTLVLLTFISETVKTLVFNRITCAVRAAVGGWGCADEHIWAH